jgi:hypothetical protein
MCNNADAVMVSGRRSVADPRLRLSASKKSPNTLSIVGQLSDFQLFRILDFFSTDRLEVVSQRISDGGDCVTSESRPVTGGQCMAATTRDAWCSHSDIQQVKDSKLQ